MQRRRREGREIAPKFSPRAKILSAAPFNHPSPHSSRMPPAESASANASTDNARLPLLRALSSSLLERPQTRRWLMETWLPLEIFWPNI